jgi:hypothetical protein
VGDRGDSSVTASEVYPRRVKSPIRRG